MSEHRIEQARARGQVRRLSEDSKGLSSQWMMVWTVVPNSEYVSWVL